MRSFVTAVLVAFLTACSPPSGASDPRSSGANAPASGANEAEQPTFAIAPQAPVGQWSFDRSCGLYDLVFAADGGVQFYDYTDRSHVVTRVGAWAVVNGSRIVLTVHGVDESGAPRGASETYSFDVSQPISDDLDGRFGLVGGEMREINARRCPEEDRE